MSHRSGSAGEPPAPEQIGEWRRRMSPPDNEFPAAVGHTALLARTHDVAVGITSIVAFSTGFQFTLAVRLREAPREGARFRLFMLVGSHHHPGVEIPLEERLLLGLEYADGRRASTLENPRPPGSGAEAGDERLLLAQQGGGADERSVDQTYWVSSLPPEGPVTVVVAWPAFGIPETSTVIEGAAIRAAAGDSQLLWPPQPPTERRPPAVPPRPSTGWFAEAPD